MSEEKKIVKPIRPDEVLSAKSVQIPSEMFEAINELIVKHWNGHSSMFKQEELEELFLSKLGESNIRMNRDKIYNNHWLDFEDIYRKEGWKVDYDKPGFNESYDATFEFKKLNKK